MFIADLRDALRPQPVNFDADPLQAPDHKGLALFMLAATIWHIPREEYMNMALTLINAGVMAFIAYGRARLVPLSDRGSAKPAM
jgi:hypothetical protein